MPLLFKWANNPDLLRATFKQLTTEVLGYIQWLAGDNWDEQRMRVFGRYASQLADAVLGALILEDAATPHLHDPIPDDAIMVEYPNRPRLREMVIRHLTKAVWEQSQEGEKFKTVGMRASEYIDEVIAARGEREIRSHNPDSPTLPPPTGWLGYWLDSEHTIVAFYPSKFDDLLKERGFAPKAARAMMIDEGRIEKSDRPTTTKRDPETKKPIRVIVYKTNLAT